MPRCIQLVGARLLKVFISLADSLRGVLSLSRKQTNRSYMSSCKYIGCTNSTLPGSDFCTECLNSVATVTTKNVNETNTLSEKYPQYYKSVGDMTEIDVYAVHHLFNIQDPSGCIQHASKKLLLSGVRTGGKSVYSDIKEARDTLSRWLQLNQEH